MRNSYTIRCLVAIALAAIFAPATHAAQKFFRGTGAWDTNTTANWSLTSNGTYDQKWLDGDDAVFENTAGTVTINGTIRANSVTFNLTGFAITGGTNLTLNQAATSVTVVTGGTATISSIIAGTGSQLVKLGLGQLTMSNTNTYSGGTLLTAGTIQVNNNNSVLGSGTLTFNGGTLTNSATPTLPIPVVVNPVTGNTIRLGGTDIGMSGNISGTGDLSVLSSGGACSLNWTGTNSGYSGTITYNHNNLNVFLSNLNAPSPSAKWVFTTTGAAPKQLAARVPNGSIVSLGEISSLASTPTAGRIANDQANATVIYSIGALNTSTNYGGVIVDSAGAGGAIVGITKVGTGTLTLSGANTFTGATTVSTGTLSLSGGTALADTNAVTLANTAGAILDIATSETIGSLAGAGTSGGEVTLNANTLTVGGNNASTTFAGPLTGTGGITKNGTGTQTMSGLNTYSGATLVNAGKLVEVNGSAIGPVTVAAGATFGIQPLVTGGQATAGNLTLNAGSTTLDFDFGTLALNNAIAPIQVANLTLNGSTQFTVRSTSFAANTSYALIKYAGTFSGTLPSTANVLPRLAVAATLVNNTGNKTIEMVVTSNAQIQQPLNWATGNGTWDTVTANWKDAAGTTATYLDLGTQSDNVQFEDTFSATGPITVTLNSVFTPASFLANSTKQFTLSGTGGIGGTIGLAKQNTGTLVLSTTNSYSGNTTVTGGTLSVSADGNLGAVPGSATPGKIVLNGGALQSSSTFTLSPNRGIALGPASGTGNGTFDVTGANTLTYNGIIANNPGGTGGYTKTGTGTLALTNTSSSFTGDILVSQGTLLPSGLLGSTATTGSLGNPNVAGRKITAAGPGILKFNTADILGNAAATTLQVGLFIDNGGTITNNALFNRLGLLTFNNGGTLSSIGGTNSDFEAYYLAGNVVVQGNAPGTISSTGTRPGVHLATNTLFTVSDVTGDSNSDLIVTAPFINQTNSQSFAPGGFTKSGAGTMTLSGANTFTGPATLTQGVLALNTAATANINRVSGNGGTLLWTGPGSATVSIGELSGSSGIVANGTASSTTTFNIGALNTSTTFSGAIQNNVGAAGAISAVTKVGSGALTLAGNQTYTGATSVNTGKLFGTTSGSFASPITVATGATAGVQVLAANGQWTVANLTTNSGTTGLDFNFGAIAPSTTTPPIKVASNFVLNGNVQFNIFAASLAAGTYPLLEYSGTLTGTVPTTPGILPLGVSATLTHNSGTRTISLVVNGINQPLTWAAGNTNWDFATPNIWKDATSAFALFNNGNSVVFEDSQSGASPVVANVSTNVNPSSIQVANSTKAFTLSGPGAIGGGATLTKSGTNTLTVSGANSYFGGTTIGGGTVIADNNSALGTGLIALAGATLSNTSNANTLSNPVQVNVLTTTLSYTNSNGNGGLGQHATGTFVATATTQAFTMLGNSSTQLNALQVRQVPNGSPLGWTTPQTIAGDSDVLTLGASKYAYAWSNTATSVNGVNFTGTNSTTAGGGDVSMSGLTSNTVSNYQANPLTDLPYGGLSAAYQNVIKGGDFAAAVTVTITLRNLAIGSTYAVQVWVNDSRANFASRTETLTFSGSNAITIANNLALNGNMSGVGALAVSMTAPSALSLGGDNSAYAGTLSYNNTNGSLLLTTPSAGSALAKWSLAGTATTNALAARTPNGSVISLGEISGAGRVANDQPGTQVIYSVGALNTSTTLSGPIVDSLNAAGATTAISKVGTGTLTLSGSSAYSGGMTLNAGTVSLANTAALGSGPLTFNGGTLLNNTLNGGPQFPNPVFVNAVPGNTISAQGKDYGFTGNFTGSGNILITFPNVCSVTFGGDNSNYSGTVTYNNVGNLFFSSPNAGSAKARWIFTGGTGNAMSGHLPDGSTVSLGEISGTTGRIANDQANTLLTYNIGALNTSSSYAGKIDDSAGAGGARTAITKVGTGALTLSNITSVFSGDLTIAQGSIVASGAQTNVASSSLGHPNNATRKINVNSGASLVLSTADILGNAGATMQTTLFIDGGTVTNNALFNRLGPVTFNNGGLLISTGGTNTSFQAYYLPSAITVQGNAPATITSSGTLSGIHLGSNTPINVADVTGNSNADLIISGPLINQTNTQGFAAAGLTKTGAGTLLLAVPGAYTGSTTITAGTLEVAANGGSATGTSFITANGGTLAGTGAVTSSVSVTAGGNIAPGALSGTSFGKLTTGALTLGGSATFQLVAPDNGAVNIGGDDEMLVNGNLTLGGTLVINGTGLLPGVYHLFTATGTVSGAFATLTLPDNYSGAINVTGGSVDITLNHAPVLAMIGNQSVNEGSTLNFTASATDADSPAQTVTYSFFGTAPAGAMLDSNSGVFSWPPMDGPTQTTNVTIRATDNGPGSFFDEETFTITVNNVNPTATLSNGGTVNEHTAGSVSFSGQSDPSSNDTTAGFRYSYDFNYNGVTPSFEVGGNTYATADLNSSVVVPPQFLDDNPNSTILGRVWDKDGGFTDYTTVITINNVAPTAALNNSGTVTEGAPSATVTFSSPLDPSNADTTAGLHYAYDFDNDGNFDVGGASYVQAVTAVSATIPAAFLDDGAFDLVVRGRIYDKDNAFTEYTTTIHISNVAPTAVLGPIANTTEGGTTSVSLTSQFDPSITDTNAGFKYSYDFNYAGGVPQFDLGGNSYAAADFAQNPTIPANQILDGPATQTVLARIWDKDNGFTDRTGTFSIANAAPALSNLSATIITENGTVVLSGIITDPGVLDTFTVVIDWMDGTVDSYAVLASATGAQNFAFSHQYLDDDPTNTNFDNYAVSITVTDNDGDSDSAIVFARVNDANPVVSIQNGLAPHIPEHTTTGLITLATFTDAGTQDTHSVTVNWGDGSPLDLGATLIEPVGATPGQILANHLYDDGPGVRTVTVTVTDDDNGVGVATFNVIVDNVAPTAVFQRPDAGSFLPMTSVEFVNPFDPSNADTTAGFLYSYDWNNDGVFEVALSQLSSMTIPPQYLLSHPNHVIHGRITDKDGGHSDYLLQQPFFASSLLEVTFDLGAQSSYTLAATAQPAPNYTIEVVDLPDGIPNLAAIGLSFDGVATISGVPTVGGLVTLRATASNFAGTETVDLIITIKRPVNSNNPQIVSQATANPNPCIAGTPVTFSVVATDRDGDVLSYFWTFADGSTARGRVVTHTYTTAGTYKVVVSISDGKNEDTFDQFNLVVAKGSDNLFDVQQAKVSFDFRKPEKSTLYVTGFIPVPSGPIAGVIANVGITGTTYAQTFQFDSKGAAGDAMSLFSVKTIQTGTGTSRAKFVFSLKSTNGQDPLNPSLFQKIGGIFPATTQKAGETVPVPLVVTIGSQAAQTINIPMLYKVVPNRSGKGQYKRK